MTTTPSTPTAPDATTPTVVLGIAEQSLWLIWGQPYPLYASRQGIVSRRVSPVGAEAFLAGRSRLQRIAPC